MVVATKGLKSVAQVNDGARNYDQQTSNKNREDLIKDIAARGRIFDGARDDSSDHSAEKHLWSTSTSSILTDASSTALSHGRTIDTSDCSSATISSQRSLGLYEFSDSNSIIANAVSYFLLSTSRGSIEEDVSSVTVEVSGNTLFQQQMFHRPGNFAESMKLRCNKAAPDPAEEVSSTVSDFEYSHTAAVHAFSQDIHTLLGRILNAKPTSHILKGVA